MPQAGAGFLRTDLHNERYCISMRRDRPAARNFDLDRWLAWPHPVVSSRGAQRTPLDDQLALLGRERRIGIVVPSFQMAPPLLRATDLIAMLPCFFIAREADLCYFDPPIAEEGFSLYPAIANRSANDVAVQHVTDRNLPAQQA